MDGQSILKAGMAVITVGIIAIFAYAHFTAADVATVPMDNSIEKAAAEKGIKIIYAWPEPAEYLTESSFKEAVRNATAATPVLYVNTSGMNKRYFLAGTRERIQPVVNHYSPPGWSYAVYRFWENDGSNIIFKKDYFTEFTTGFMMWAMMFTLFALLVIAFGSLGIIER